MVAKDLGGENRGGILSEGQDALEMFKRAVYSSVTYTSREDEDKDVKVEQLLTGSALFYQRDRACLLKWSSLKAYGRL